MTRQRVERSMPKHVPLPVPDSGRSRRRVCSSQQPAEADWMAGHTSLDTPTRARGHRSTRPDRLFKEPRRTCSRDCKQSLRAGPVRRPKANNRHRARPLRPKSGPGARQQHRFHCVAPSLTERGNRTDDQHATHPPRRPRALRQRELPTARVQRHLPWGSVPFDGISHGDR